MSNWNYLGMYKPDQFFIRVFTRPLTDGWFEIKWMGDGKGTIKAHVNAGYTPDTKALRKLVQFYGLEFALYIYSVARQQYR